MNKMKEENRYIKYTVYALAALVVCCAIAKLYSMHINNYKTQTAYVQTVSESTDAQMFIIRSETIIDGAKEGAIVVPLAVNGERVSNGSEIAAVFTNEKSADNYSTVISLNKKLDTYKKIDSQVRLANLDLDKLSAEIDSDFCSMLSAVYENNYSKLNETELSFDEKLSRKNISLDIEVDCSAQISDLEKEIKALSSSSPKDVISASSAGYFVSRPDGYENVLTVDKIDSLTPEKLEKAFKAEKSEIKKGTIGKIINGYNWYVATYVSSSAIAGLSKGSRVQLVLGDGENLLVNANVYSNTLTDDNKSLVVFKCSYMNDELATLRKVTGKIITGSYKGIKIKKDAIRFDEKGNEGVYIKEGNLIKFNVIDEVYSNDNYVIAADNTGVPGKLARYDEIVIAGKELSNGKVLD